MDSIFTVAILKDYREFHEARVVGWFHVLSEALASAGQIEKPDGDHVYLVVQQCFPGLREPTITCAWFWHNASAGWERCDAPYKLSRLCNIGMG